MSCSCALELTKIAILGSTGSIGTQTLDIIRHSRNFEVVLLACDKNVDLLEKQIEEFKPKFAVVSGETRKLNAQNTVVYYGKEYLSDYSLLSKADVIVNAIGGIAGLSPTLAALKLGLTVASANKESIVVGSIPIAAALEGEGALLPIDSEHSTLWQCLSGGVHGEVDELILTASGGAFRDLTAEELKYAKAIDALKHPNWSMGNKITVDCATMVNKGLELFEAKALFGIDKISAVIHRESIIHALVSFKDGAVLAGLSYPDMRIPISLAINCGTRKKIDGIKKLSLSQIKSLSFEEIDRSRFGCYKIAEDIAAKSGNARAIYTFANDVLVDAYLKDKISFTDFPVYIADALEKLYSSAALTAEDEIFDIERRVKEYTTHSIGRNK